MPNSRGKRRNSEGSFGTRHLKDYVRKVHATSDFEEVVEILRRAFDIPDYSTKSGLRKIHEDFAAVHSRLDLAFTKHHDDNTIRGGIVSIFARMCADSILRDKIYERGIIRKLLPLMNTNSCRHLALDTLSILTMPGGISILIEIARLSPILMQLMMKHSDDEDVLYLCLLTLLRTLPTALPSKQEPDPIVARTLDIPQLFNIFLNVLRRPNIPFRAVDQCLELTAIIAHHFPEYLAQNPQLVNFVVAGFRSKRWDCRSKCLSTLICLHNHDPVVLELNKLEIDMTSVAAAALRGVDGHLQSIMARYGLERCEFTNYRRSMDAALKPFLKYTRDRDLYELGLSLAEYVTNFEFVLMVPLWTIPGTRLPFQSFEDALQMCSQTMQEGPRRNEHKHIPDILKTKLLLTQRRHPEAISLAELAIGHSPDVAWFYYVIAVAAEGLDANKGAKAAMKGLRCTKTTPYIRNHLLHLAVCEEAQLAMFIFRAYPLNKPWDEGIALYTSALKEADTFIREAPPDHRRMSAVLDYSIVLHILVGGPTIDENLNDEYIQNAEKKLKDTDKFYAIWTGSDDKKTLMRLIKETIMKNYHQAAMEWRSLLMQIDEDPDDLPTIPENAVDELTEWLEGSEDLLNKPITNDDAELFVDLRQCECCGNPSAVLKKCAGCSQARYCNTTCQKEHWKVHRKTCKSKS